MNDRKTGGLKLWTPAIFSLVLISGMVLGFNLRDTLRNKRDIGTLVERNDRLEQMIDLINEKYVDTVNTNVLYKDAVNGILSHLDPHTVYIPADELQTVNDDLEGSFFGIGVEFSILHDTIQFTSVIEGGPAEKAGIAIGDQLIKVGDSLVAGNGITSERIIKMLKGKQFSSVFVTLRSVDGTTKNISIKRDAVPIYSVDADLMLDSKTGYIKINRFAATTYDEFKKALQSLLKQGMTQLVIDLRQNPGGYVDAATHITDEFLSGNKLIVYTQGKHSARTEYRAGSKGLFEEGKLAVLVDESSASASEILSGAIQDWDRGVIIGRRTFGKGLVQDQYDMGDGSALRLTIARYFTPSGRCIQRSFAKGKDAYTEDFVKRFESGELTGRDTIKLTDTTRYYTSLKRAVFAGGGIKPDIYVPYDTAKLHPGLLNILFSDEVHNLIWAYYIGHRNQLRMYKGIDDYKQYFNSDELVKLFVAQQEPKMKQIVQKVLSNETNYSYFALNMKAQLARYLFRNNGYYSINAMADNVVQKALQILSTDEYTSIIHR